MPDDIGAWHDFYVSLVTAAAALLGLLFVALSLHIRALSAPANAELRSVARSIFLGYVGALGIGFCALLPQTTRALGVELLLLFIVSTALFVAAARAGLRATGVGFERRVTVLQFVAGFGFVVVTNGAAIGVIAEQPTALYVIAASAIVGLLWGVFNTWELIFRMQIVGRRED
jgi:modulator of FtsH protease